MENKTVEEVSKESEERGGRASECRLSQCQVVDSKAKESFQECGADFEEAITAVGYGKFHYLLFLVLIPATWSSFFDTSNMSMILPAAECDLQLSLIQKGVLNAAAYAGMVSSAFIWGFMADVTGRRKILVYGFIFDGICNVLNGFSPNFIVLVIFKFLSGFIISGPYATVTSYYAEFHPFKDRPKKLLGLNAMSFIGNILNAGLAWLIIPQAWALVFGDDVFIYSSWRIYLSICGLPIIFGGICLFFFPESPKFLMSKGRNEEAMEVFKKIYSANSGKPADMFPIKLLENETFQIHDKSSVDPTEPKSFGATVCEGLRQMKPLFVSSYVFKLLLLFVIQFCTMLSNNTIRLWQPQLLVILDQPRDDSESDVVHTFCDIINNFTFHKNNQSAMLDLADEECVEKPLNDSTYLSVLIISTVLTVSMFLAAFFVNMFGNKRLLIITLSVSLLSVTLLIWTSQPLLILVLMCLPVSMMCTATILVVNVAVEVFPTSLRTMAVSLTMMVGRIGALSGNVMFPVLLQFGCIEAVIFLSAMILVALILIIFVPKADKEVK